MRAHQQDVTVRVVPVTLTMTDMRWSGFEAMAAIAFMRSLNVRP